MKPENSGYLTEFSNLTLFSDDKHFEKIIEKVLTVALFCYLKVFIAWGFMFIVICNKLYTPNVKFLFKVSKVH